MSDHSSNKHPILDGVRQPYFAPGDAAPKTADEPTAEEAFRRILATTWRSDRLPWRFRLHCFALGLAEAVAFLVLLASVFVASLKLADFLNTLCAHISDQFPLQAYWIFKAGILVSILAALGIDRLLRLLPTLRADPIVFLSFALPVPVLSMTGLCGYGPPVAFCSVLAATIYVTACAVAAMLVEHFHLERP